MNFQPQLELLLDLFISANYSQIKNAHIIVGDSKRMT